MFTAVPIRTLISIALGLCLARCVLAQAPAAGCSSSQLGVVCPSLGARPVSPSIISHTLTPSDPKVTYVNGQLAIVAQNATMSDVLHAVSFATGAVIEFPSDQPGEPISANIGPGPVRTVLATLLNGSGFNYVMLASQNNPSILQRMILTNAAQLPPAQTAQVAPPADTAPPKTLASSPLWTPPPQDATVQPLPPQPQNDSSLTPPKEALSPEALGELMKAKFQEIREKAQQKP
jgi:hypothetical protein